MYINTNIVSLNAQANLANSQSSLATDIQRLSSGLRINSAADDAAGMAIATRMGSQISGQNQAIRNANDGISLAQTAQGAMQSIVQNLQTMRSLAVQSANATYSASDRASMNAEVQQLKSEIDRVAGSTAFNGVSLLDGTFSAMNFQVGANNTVNDSIQVASIANMHTSQLGSAGSTYAATSTSTGFAANTGTAVALLAGDLTLNGQQVGASQAGAGPGQTAASAYSIAQAINAISANSGVTAVANATTVTGTGPGTSAISANAFQINGINVGAVAAGGTAAGEGANLAAAINAISSQTGVTATADVSTGVLTLTAADGRDISITGTVTGTGLTATANSVGGTSQITGTSSAAAAVTMGVNGVTITTASLASGTTAVTAASDFVSAFNTAAATNSALNGLSASSDGSGGITITSSNGSNINVTTGMTAGTGLTLAAPMTTVAAYGAVHGTVTLSSTSSSGIVIGGAGATYAGFTTGTVSATMSSTVKSISAMDVLTASDAQSAIATIDGAINTVNSAMGQMGAVQNRFQSVVTNLQTSVQNLTAAQSRIQDTDFAATTASLTQAQILQQAGTAMLAQANALPNAVLTLLK
ncbi:MAG: flagellin [Betaproteobacteria bacterium]|nr:flagellin [Betaproteobacteria bacterium]